MEFFQMEDRKHDPTANVPHSASVSGDEYGKQYIFQVVDKFLDEFVFNEEKSDDSDSVLDGISDDSASNEVADGVWAYADNLLKCFMLLADFKDAVATGNGEHIFILRKQLLTHFFSTPGFNDFAIEMLINILQTEVLLSKAEAHRCKWAATVNWKGGAGHNIEIDLFQENRNCEMKKLISDEGDHCAVFGCNNDRSYPEKQFVCSHVGVLRFHCPRNAKERAKWQNLINRKDFKVTGNTKVCSNHFVAGYRCKECPNPTLYMKGYKVKKDKKRLPPKQRRDMPPHPRKQKREVSETQGDGEENRYQNDDDTMYYNISTLHDDITKHEKSFSDVEKNVTVKMEQQSHVSQLKRRLFTSQATGPAKCYRYTGLSREKLDLVFSFVKEKAKHLRYWRGSIETPCSQEVKRGHVPRLLTPFEEFILTLVRTRKGLDVAFLADTFEISTSQVSRIYNTWIIFLSNELSFLVPWPSRVEIQEKLPKRFKRFKNLRIIIDCAEFFIQKPKILESQKITWSSYKHWNTAKLLIGITPTGVISFIPPLWTGSVSDKEIVKTLHIVVGLGSLLEEQPTLEE
ncbi:uncharacterized protein LOC114526650 [Dendronephthya gigantea]|uniref:uncharacterized protein LOC114526650 n=1 Tax=Dendronephthya gigantea TaxID=151771 RepID=UPI00106A7425|nr:uncharacterized protein LOC114526650 [Dendronephthya gigantea]